MNNFAEIKQQYERMAANCVYPPSRDVQVYFRLEDIGALITEVEQLRASCELECLECKQLNALEIGRDGYEKGMSRAAEIAERLPVGNGLQGKSIAEAIRAEIDEPPANADESTALYEARKKDVARVVQNLQPWFLEKSQQAESKGRENITMPLNALLSVLNVFAFVESLNMYEASKLTDVVRPGRGE